MLDVGGQNTTKVGFVERVRRFLLIDGDPSRNMAMEGMRGYAALLVFFIHATGYFLVFHQGVLVLDLHFHSVLRTWRLCTPLDTALVCLSNVYYGVDLFFLMSGFLIMRIIEKARGANRFSYRGYLGKRCLRIYPTFFFALALGIAVHVGYVKDRPFIVYDFLCNLFFLNGCDPLRLGVLSYAEASWSLFYEICFYLAMPCLLLVTDCAGRKRLSAKLLRPVVILAVTLLIYDSMPRFAMFTFGILVGSLSDDALKRLASQLSTRWVLAVYLAACATLSLTGMRTAYFLPLFGPAAMLLFIKACWDGGFLNKVFSTPALRGFGNISYSFYLTHVSSIIVAAHWLREPLKSLPLIPAYAIFLSVCMAMSLCTGLISFAICERWYFRRGKPLLAEQEVREHPAILPSIVRKAA